MSLTFFLQKFSQIIHYYHSSRGLILVSVPHHEFCMLNRCWICLSFSFLGSSKTVKTSTCWLKWLNRDWRISSYWVNSEVGSYTHVTVVKISRLKRRTWPAHSRQKFFHWQHFDQRFSFGQVVSKWIPTPLFVPTNMLDDDSDLISFSNADVNTLAGRNVATWRQKCDIICTVTLEFNIYVKIYVALNPKVQICNIWVNNGRIPKIIGKY